MRWNVNEVMGRHSSGARDEIFEIRMRTAFRIERQYGAPAHGLTSADIEMNSVVYDAAEVSVPKHWSACMRDFVKRRDTFVVNQPMRR